MRGMPAVVAFAMVVTASTARGDERHECARAYEQAQRLQQSGEMKKALEAAERCAQSSCPSLLEGECKPWVAKIRKELPTIEVHVSGADGCSLRDVTMEIDRVKHLPWTELPVDPGVHEVRFVDSATTRIVEKTINVGRGEHRVVELALAPEGVTCGGSATTALAAQPIPKVAVGLGIAGGGLLLTGVLLGVVGAVKRGDLEDCKPSCSSADIDGTRAYFVAGDVVGAVGILTLGAAAAVFFFGRGDAGMRATSIRAAPRGVELRF